VSATLETEIDPRTTPNGCGFNDAELELEGYRFNGREIPTPTLAPPVFQYGDRCWYKALGYVEARIRGLRCDDLWVDGEDGQPELMPPEWEYKVVSVHQLTTKEYPEEWGWCKASELLSVQPED